MCGIAGLVTLPGRPAPDAALGRRMLDAILHRGPDEGGLHADALAMLGMRRLSIIDSEGSHQPLYGADGRVCLVFNGEIYNYRELRHELVKLGHGFSSQGDGEVILRAYLEYGVRCFEKLDGMFAVALWDARTNELVLARDRFGEKPLYYCHQPDGLLFGSELKAMLRAPSCPREVDADGLRSYLTYGYVPSPLCILRGVRKLPQGHWLRFRDGAVELGRYWLPRMGPALDIPDEEAERMLEERLDAAVSSRLVADVPFGAFLSGGLDSSTVVALMARNLSTPVKTFSIGFEENGFSELDDARRVARHFQTEHHELVVRPDAVSLMQTLAWHFDEPFADSSAIPTYLVSELARRHVKMVLTGDAGDELFGGYDRYLRQLRMERLGTLRRPAASLLRHLGPWLPDPRGFRMRRIGERMALPFAQRYLSGVALMREDEASALLPGSPGRDHYDLPFLHARDPYLGAGESVLARIIALDVQSYLPDDLLVKVDRMSMAVSLESRAPFLDPRLADFAFRLPDRLRVQGGVGKHLLRRVARKWLPPEVLSKPKQGFAIPLAQWLRGPLAEMTMDTFGSNGFKQRGLLEPGVINALVSEHMTARRDHSEPIWQALCLELWARQFLDSHATSVATDPLPVRV